MADLEERGRYRRGGLAAVSAPSLLALLSSVEAADEAATSGEWSAEGGRVYATVERQTTSVTDRHRGEVAVATKSDPLYRHRATETAAFIALARTAAPALARACREQMEEIERRAREYDYSQAMNDAARKHIEKQDAEIERLRRVADLARIYLKNDGSGIGRQGEWGGCFDAMILADTRVMLRAALDEGGKK